MVDYILLAVMAISFSTASIFVLLTRLPGPSAATWRLAISSAIMWVLVMSGPGTGPSPFSDKTALLASLISGIFLALHFDLWMTSLYVVPVGVSVALVDSYPAFIWALGHLIFNERYSALEIVGSIVTVVGVVGLTLVKADPGNWIEGVTLSLGGMGSMVCYVLIGRWVRTRWPTRTYTAVTYSFGAIVSSVISVLSHSLVVPTMPVRVAAVLGLALVPMMGGHTIMNYLLGKEKILPSTIAMTFEPAGASILAMLIFGQRLSPSEWAFIIAIVLGISLSSLGISGASQ
ncbi:MAG: DMT family transporter [Acidilobus sp.]